MILSSISPSQLNSVAADIINFAEGTRIFLFYGDMGAGKTTLIQSICKYLGTAEAITSPTFSIVNQYEAIAGDIYHFDFYRLKNQSEALDLGYEEYFFSGAYCFIEWPEKIPGLLPAKYVKVEITVTGNETRQINIAKI